MFLSYVAVPLVVFAGLDAVMKNVAPLVHHHVAYTTYISSSLIPEFARLFTSRILFPETEPNVYREVELVIIHIAVSLLYTVLYCKQRPHMFVLLMYTGIVLYEVGLGYEDGVVHRCLFILAMFSQLKHYVLILERVNRKVAEGSWVTLNLSLWLSTCFLILTDISSQQGSLVHLGIMSMLPWLSPIDAPLVVNHLEYGKSPLIIDSKPFEQFIPLAIAENGQSHTAPSKTELLPGDVDLLGLEWDNSE